MEGGGKEGGAAMEEAQEVRGSRQRERTIRTEEEGAHNISVAISHVTAALRRRAPLPLGLGRFEFNRFAINKQGDTAPMRPSPSQIPACTFNP